MLFKEYQCPMAWLRLWSESACRLVRIWEERRFPTLDSMSSLLEPKVMGLLVARLDNRTEVGDFFGCDPARVVNHAVKSLKHILQRSCWRLVLGENVDKPQLRRMGSLPRESGATSHKSFCDRANANHPDRIAMPKGLGRSIRESCLFHHSKNQLREDGCDGGLRMTISTAVIFLLLLW
jgi:hypothetical protein